MKAFSFIILICLILTPFTHAGSEVTEGWVIRALDSMEEKGILELSEEPLTREEVASLVISISDKWDILPLEQKSYLLALEREFAPEINSILDSAAAEESLFLKADTDSMLKSRGYNFIYREDFSNLVSIRDVVPMFSGENVRVREVSFGVQVKEGNLRLEGEGFKNPTILDYLLRGAAIFNAGYRFLDDEETKEITGGLASMGLDYFVSPNEDTKFMATMALEKGMGQVDMDFRWSTSAGLEYSFAEGAILKADYTIDENILNSTTIHTSLEFGYTFTTDTFLTLGYSMIDFSGYEGRHDDFTANLALAEFSIKF